MDSITFSNGVQINTSNLSLFVLVGPNNSGKSEFLREIERLAAGPDSPVVLSSASFSRSGESNTIEGHLERRFFSQRQNGNNLFNIWGNPLWSQSVKGQWDGQLGTLSKLFVSRISTDERLSDSNPVNSVDLRSGAATHPIHLMQFDPNLESAASAQFYRAFNLDLLVDRFGGSKVGLLVGNRPEFGPGEDRISTSYREKIDASTNALEKQGDGMRAFATIVSRVLALDTASVILIDEPEAFLHPPQVKMLGEFLATKVPTGKQVVVASHSRDFIVGAISESTSNMAIARLVREGNENVPNLLPHKLAEEISKDALMRHSSVLDGIFHERVIICEADADSMFYQSILQSLATREDALLDVLFVQSGGKQKMPYILRSLMGLGVPTDVIVDIDALNDETFFKKLFEQAGGVWADIQNLYSQVTQGVTSIAGVTKNRDLQQYFAEKIATTEPSDDISRDHKSALNRIFSDSSPWGRIKRAGAAALPNGQPSQNFEELFDACSSVGIWLVKVGEMEGFCKSIGNKGQRWVQKVLETKDIATDPELENARQFMTAIWFSKT